MLHTFSLSENPILQNTLKNIVHEYMLKQLAEDLQIDRYLNMYIKGFFNNSYMYLTHCQKLCNTKLKLTMLSKHSLKYFGCLQGM